MGWLKDEVYFRKGKPTSEEKIGDDEILTYGSNNIWIEKNKVIAIGYVCSNESYEYTKIGGISCSDRIDKLLELYGNSKFLSVSEDKLNRIYNYPEYHLSFSLTMSQVIELYVFDPKAFKAGGFFFMPAIPGASKEEKKEAEVTAESSKPTHHEYTIEDIESAQLSDHCAPNLKKAERLRRLAEKGKVRETGYQTYTTGNYEIAFSGNELINCR